MEAAKRPLYVWSAVAPLRHQRAQIAGGLEPMQVIGKGNSSRWILDAFDRAALEHAFRLDPFPNASARQQLGLELNVSPRQIQVWFQNRRQREKLQNAGRLPNTHRVDSPRGTDVPFAGMKQKRDVMRFLVLVGRGGGGPRSCTLQRGRARSREVRMHGATASAWV